MRVQIVTDLAHGSGTEVKYAAIQQLQHSNCTIFVTAALGSQQYGNHPTFSSPTATLFHSYPADQPLTYLPQSKQLSTLRLGICLSVLLVS